MEEPKTDSVLYHLILVEDHERCKKSNDIYYPRTYQQDGFTHLTADPQLLLSVANQFYQDSQGHWRLLVLDPKKLGAEVKYEAAAAVGNKPAAKVEAGEKPKIFPHLYGGINLDAVQKVLPVQRDSQGRFTQIEGI